MMKALADAARVTRAMSARVNSEPPMPAIFPDYPAPFVVCDGAGGAGGAGGLEMRDVR